MTRRTCAARRHAADPSRSDTSTRPGTAHPRPEITLRSLAAPLNYLTLYRRGLNLVTYLTTRDGAGTFRRRPLRYRYWATIQQFNFTPQYPAPPANAAFLGMWPFTGGVRVVTGASGRGEVADAPYFTTAAGTDYNTHFNTLANWTITERPTW